MKWLRKLGEINQVIHDHGGSVAMAAAAALTAKGEYDLAKLVKYPGPIAWLLPVALDVYLATAAAKRARKDIAIGLLLMMGCQIAVHLVEVRKHLDPGFKVPWGLVVVVVCVPPLIALRAMLGMKGNGEAEREAAEQAERERVAAERERAAAEQVREAQRRVADAERARVDIEQRLAAETEAREAAEQAARDAEAKAARAAARRAKTHTDGDGGGSASGASSRRQVTHPGGVNGSTVTRDGDASGAGDAPGQPEVTHGGDASGPNVTHDGGAPLTREERLELAVMEALNDASVSARAAALKHGVDAQAVQRRVRAARQQNGGIAVTPLRGPAVNGQKPNLTSNP